MANVFFRRRPTRIDAGELQTRLAELLATRTGASDIDVVVDAPTRVVLRWTDGPASARVADVVAEVVNWEVRGPSGAPPESAVVVLDRRFSARAIAVAVVRYAAANVSPYDSNDPRAVARLSTILDQDNPATSGYPIADRIAGLLLAEAPGHADDPGVGNDQPSPADTLAATLAAVGYDRLWHQAWREVG